MAEGSKQPPGPKEAEGQCPIPSHGQCSLFIPTLTAVGSREPWARPHSPLLAQDI